MHNSSGKVSSGLLFVVVGLCVLGVAAMGYIYLYQPPLGPREAIDDGIRSARKAGPLSSQDEQLLRVQLALSQYMKSHDAPPKDLKALVPQYFEKIPTNPKTKEPFFYQRRGSTFKLRLFDPERGKPVPEGAEADEAIALAKGSDTQVDDGDFVNPNTIVEEDSVYDPSESRDPFRPFDLVKKRDDGSPRTELERYEIGQLSLTAVLNDADGEMTAIVENAAGKGFTVRVGTKIGDASGVVVKILPDRLKVLESQVDFTGEEKTRVVDVKLYKKNRDQ